MSTTQLHVPESEKMPREHYLNATYGIRSWLLTTDHKRIAILYLISVTFFFFLGGLFASLIRIHLLTPGGYLVTPETYNKLFTMHGVAMIFFFLIPSIPAVLGNFVIPIMIGAKDLAFPKINLLSWYIYLVGGAFVLYSFATGGLDTGWTFYTPLSSIYSNSAVTPAVIGIFINGFSSILTGLNCIVTVHTMRALAGHDLDRVCRSLISGALRNQHHLCSGHAGHRDHSASLAGLRENVPPRLLQSGLRAATRFCSSTCSGFTRILPFTSLILPAMGVISEIIPTFARKPIFGYDFIAASSIGIAVIGFIVWAHHMFLTGQINVFSRCVFIFDVSCSRPVGSQSIQLDPRRFTKVRLPSTRRCFMASALSDYSRLAASPDSFSRAWAWIFICTTLTSWSRTSTTSWSEGRSWGTWVESISGGQKSPGVCTLNILRGLRPSSCLSALT